MADLRQSRDGRKARVTAARGVLAGEDDKTSASPGVSSERLPAAAGLLCLIVLGVLLRLVPTVFVPSINWGDEIFQTVEPAHRLVFGYGLVPWEFELGMRSWLLPGVLAGLIEIARIVGDGPRYYLSAIAIGLGVLACAPVVCCFLWCRRAFGLGPGFVAAFAVAIAPELVYFGARPLNEVVAAHLLVIAFYLLEPGYWVSSRRRVFVGAMLLGVVCLLRIHLAPAVAVLFLWSAWGGWRQRLRALISGGLAALAFGATLDWLTLGYPFASIWRNLLYNIYYGVSTEISADPNFYYLRGVPRATATGSSMAVLSVYWSFVAFNVWSGETLGPLRQRAHDELVAMSLVHDMPTLCGVGLSGEEAWVRYGGYTYLHRPVPMYWPKDAAELTASATAFDTLLFDS